MDTMLHMRALTLRGQSSGTFMLVKPSRSRGEPEDPDHQVNQNRASRRGSNLYY